MKSAWYVSLATLGPLGYLKGSGTWATLITLPLVYVLGNYFLDPLLHAAILCVLLIGTLLCVQYASRFFPGDSDPSAIVLDEVIGCLIVWYGIPLHGFSLIVGLCSFRMLDIFKPLGINQIEDLKSPWGIVFDDVVAALIANAFVRVLLHVLYV